jgi:hypothetical protein
MKLESKLMSLIAGLSFTLVALTGCSSNDLGNAPRPSYSCASKGPCENDPVPSANEAASCQSLQDDTTCGEAFTAYSTCAYSAAKCADGGMSDPTGDSTSTECSSAYADYTTCLENKMVDGG